jgi:hypothetical protein
MDLGEALAHTRAEHAVAFEVHGAIGGYLVLVVDDAATTHLVARVGAAARGRRVESVLAEIGNIIASSFLNPIAADLGGSCVPSVPRAFPFDAVEVTALASERRPDALFVVPLACAQGEISLVFAPVMRTSSPRTAHTA